MGFQFTIPMKDQDIEFMDVIDLSVEQQELIINDSSYRTMEEWRNEETGIKIPLENWQQDAVLAHKNLLVEAKEERALLKDRTIIFTKHSKDRVALRVEKVQVGRPPKLESLLLVIRLVIESNVVDKQAEWKGHKNLVYTLLHTGLGERFKISISFETIGTENIKVITVSNEHINELTAKLIEQDNIRESLEQLKKRLTLIERQEDE